MQLINLLLGRGVDTERLVYATEARRRVEPKPKRPKESNQTSRALPLPERADCDNS